jgi:hypothetical protein
LYTRTREFDSEESGYILIPGLADPDKTQHLYEGCLGVVEVQLNYRRVLFPQKVKDLFL